MAQPLAMNTLSSTQRVVRKILVTTVTGGIAFLLTDLTNQPQASALMMTVMIGGIALLIQFLVDFEQRQQAVEDRLGSLERAQPAIATKLTEDVRHEIAKINEATEFFHRIERSMVRADPVVKLAHLSADAGDDLPPLARKLVQAEITAAAALLEQLSHGGESSYDGEDRDWLLELTERASRSIDATSPGSWAPDGLGFLDESFWESELSYRYLELQRDAVRRSVTVRRIFILEDAGLAEDQRFRKICEHQLDAGIVVRTLDASSLTPSRRLTLPGLVLFDDEISYELIQGPRLASSEAPYFIRTRLVVRPQAVRERVRLFADLWEAADDYRGP